jgi:hypothetical protein
MNDILPVKKNYSELWPDIKEIAAINNFGMEIERDLKGHEISRRQIKPDAYIISCLEGYLRGAHLKDWVRCDLSETHCCEAATIRLRELKEKNHAE